jgi:hypothetical protein
MLWEGLPSPVTGIPGVVAVFASDVEVGAVVAVLSLVLVASAVVGGALVLGTLVGVGSAPQAANSKAARTSVVKNKFTFFIRTDFLSFFRQENLFFPPRVFL